MKFLITAYYEIEIDSETEEQALDIAIEKPLSEYSDVKFKIEVK